ncbi:MAG: DUF5615 family PIN-like protein [Planctomycetes bacterium]|nr:DUF5615 family PIN-like protein [Planctomycetota bacterium]
MDENLSPKLSARLRPLFPGIQHLDLAGLRGQVDHAIWDFARDHDLAIVIPRSASRLRKAPSPLSPEHLLRLEVLDLDELAGVKDEVVDEEHPGPEIGAPEEPDALEDLARVLAVVLADLDRLPPEVAGPVVRGDEGD